jgi:dipeptidyl aminopeptidase/acylaminoacyl peptidase
VIPPHTPIEAPWRRRFRAPRLITLPLWARDEPDRVLYGTNAPGKWELFAWDRTTGVHRQVTDRPAGTWPHAGRIHPTGQTIWWFDDEKGNEFGRWVIEPFDGKEPRLAVPLPPAYPAGAVLARDFAVIGRSDDAGTTIHLVADEGRTAGVVLYSHREHAWVAGISRDDTLLAVNHSEHGDARHPAVRILDTAGGVIADLQDEPGRGLIARAWSPVAGDQRLIIEHERADMARPLILDGRSGRTVDVEFDLPGEVDAGWYPDASALLITHDFRGRSELFRMNLDGLELTKIDTEPGTIVGARVRPDGSIWHLWSNAARPIEVLADGEVLLRPGGEPAPEGRPYTDAAVGDVHVFVAEPPAPRPHPTVFLVHGGPESHDRDVFSPSVQAWVDHGFAVLLVNYRGSDGYGRRWRDAIQGNPGFTELADIASVREWAVASGLADPSRVILAGTSWGGYLTLLGLGRHPDLWSLGIAAVPVGDFLAAYEDEMDPLKAYDRALFGGTPAEMPEVYRLRSPITYADQVRVPLLILAGDNDPRCPIRQIENYVARLRASGKVYELYRYDAGHGAPVIEEAIRQVERQIAFAARYLGTPPPQ